MMLPPQLPPIPRRAYSHAQARLILAAGGGTCSCDGSTWTGCSVKHDGCNAGYWADCGCNVYGAGCECKPNG